MANKPMFSRDIVYTFSYGFGFIFPSVSEYAFALTIYSELWELISSSIIFPLRDLSRKTNRRLIEIPCPARRVFHMMSRQQRNEDHIGVPNAIPPGIKFYIIMQE